MSKSVWRILSGVAGGLVVFFVVRHLLRNWAEVHSAPIAWRVSPAHLVASLGVVLSTYALLVESWRRMLAGWGPLLGWWESARVWVLSSMGKYLPGKVWAIAGMALLAQRRGVPPWAATASALLLQVVSIGTGAAIVGATGTAVLETTHPGSRALLFVLFGLSAAGLVAVLSPTVAGRLIGFVTKGTGERVSPAPRAVLFGVVANTLAWLLYGVSLWLLARGLLPDAGLGLVDAIGAFAASYIAGLLFLLAPNGLGVRESVMVLMLSPGVGLANALALAAVSRIGMTVADLLAALPFIQSWKESPADVR